MTQTNDHAMMEEVVLPEHLLPLGSVLGQGVTALDLCMVAAGRLDAYYEHGLQVWDCAAGAVIAAEAGARVVLPPQNAPVGSAGSGAGLVMAAAPGIADELLAALARFNGLEPIPY